MRDSKFKLSFLHHWPSGMLKDLLLICGVPSKRHKLIGFDDIDFFKADEHMRNVLLHIFAALILMSKGKHSLARKFLAKKCCCSNWYSCIHNFLHHQQELQFMQLFEGMENIDTESLFGGRLASFIAALDVTPLPEACYKKGGYTSYYKSKKEDFTIKHQSEWLDKQKNVFEILQEYRPQTVLDIGANTGWFSMLAEHLGADVIATDIDEASVDILYNCAKGRNINIDAFVASFESLLDQGPCCLKSDMVLCLALVHHLIFASGLKLEAIFDVLSKLTNQILVLEYVDLDDNALSYGLTNADFWKSEPDFKKATDILHDYANKFYNLSTILEIGKDYFSSVTVLDSHPHTRKLIVFTK